MGRELVLNLLSKNARVIAIDISQNGLQETVSLAETNKDKLSTFVVEGKLIPDSKNTFRVTVKTTHFN